MAFRDRLKLSRKSKGLTQEELAFAIGVKKPTISSYENGNSEPSMDKLYEIMKALNVDANYLFQDEMNAQTRDQILLEKYHEADSGIRTSVDILLKMPE